jgi:hypothetical protein
LAFVLLVLAAYRLGQFSYINKQTVTSNPVRNVPDNPPSKLPLLTLLKQGRAFGVGVVLATQNPIEQEGTYPLPEAQMDRFLMHVYINYPDETSEIQVIRLVRDEEGQKVARKKDQEKVTIAQQHIFDARSQIHAVHVSDAIEKYVLDLVTATRDPGRYGDDLKKWVHIGASPRGGIGLDKCSRVHAWLAGQDYVTPDDTASPEVKAQHPLRDARIEVSEVAGKPGVYRAVAFLRPHFQLDELSVSLRLVAELPASARDRSGDALARCYRAFSQQLYSL